MSLTIPKRNVRKVVGILTEPTPQFISLVGHGGNQTPWQEVRDDNTLETPAPLLRMNQTNRVVRDAPTVDMQRLHQFTFKVGETFPHADSVVGFLQQRGYENVKVERVDNSWVVPCIAEENFTRVAPIDYSSDGTVKMWVGDRKPGVAVQRTEEIVQQVAQTTTEPVQAQTPPKRNLQRSTSTPAPANEPAVPAVQATRMIRMADTAPVRVQRFDGYLAYYSNATTIAEILHDGQDGVPVGFYDVTEAFRKALGNLIKTGQPSSIPSLTAEYGAILVTLCTLVSHVQREEERENAVRALGLSSVMNPPNPAVPATTTAPAVTPAAPAAPAAPETPAPVETQRADTPPPAAPPTPAPAAPAVAPTAPAADLATTIQEAVTRAVAPLQQQITELRETRAAHVSTAAPESRQLPPEGTTENPAQQVRQEQTQKPEMDRFERSAIGLSNIKPL